MSNSRSRCCGDPEDDDLLTEVLHLYRSERRRAIFETLEELERRQDGRATVDHYNLAMEVAAREEDCAFDDVAGRAYRSARTGLRQNHLPLLEEYGVIEWDEQSQTIQTTDRLDGYIELLAELRSVASEADILDLTERGRPRW